MTETTPPALRSLATKLCPWLLPALRQLDSARSSERLGHAWLLGGPEGVGKLNLALVFATRVLSRSALDTPPVLGPDEGATAMRDRHQPADHHPDLHWLFPEEDKRSISIDQVRAVSDSLSLTAHRGVAKVAIIEPADAMTTAAANALLKTLEEPTDNTYLFLLSRQPGRLAATIRSRCQRLDVPRPSPKALQAWLGGADPKRFAAAWLVADGAPLPMAALIHGDEIRENNELFDKLALVSEERVDAQSVAERWAKAGGELVLTWLLRQLRREIRARIAPSVSTSVTDPAGETLHNVWTKLTLRTLFAQYDKTERLLNQLGSGINMELALHALLLGFQPNRGRS